MKRVILICVLACANPLSGQEVLDTLYANSGKNVALFFPEPIRQGIVGAPHFVFSYNREQGQYFGLLQAQDGPQSNLLVLTREGRVYSYILKYREELPRLNYFISEGESIGMEMPLVDEVEIDGTEMDSLELQREYFERFSEHLLKSKPRRLAGKRSRGIGLKLLNMVYHGTETYLVVEISNQSGIAYEVDFLKIHRVSGNKGKKASFQRLEMEPVYVYGMPSKVHNGQRVQFVFVLPKFVLGDKENLQLELQEVKGNRKVVLGTRLR